MKNYKDVADEVFSRSKQVEAENKLRRRRITEIGVSAACWAAAGAVGFGIWKTNIAGKGVVTSAPAQGAGSAVIDSDTESMNDWLSQEYTKEDYIDKNGIDIRCIPLVHLPAQSFDHYYQTEPGQVVFSNALIDNMSWNNEVDKDTFDIIIEYYKDRERIDPTNEFMESESARMGIDYELETDSESGNHYIRRQNATFDMIEEKIISNDDYGIVVYLRSAFLNGVDIDIDLTRFQGRVANVDVEYEEKEYSPENGTSVIGESLKAGIEKYGRADNNGDIRYEVYIEYYKDGEQTKATKELWQQEHDRDMTVVYSTSGSEHGETLNEYIYAIMTVDDIESFEPLEGYGCALHLVDAYNGYPFRLESTIINGLYNNGVYIPTAEETSMMDIYPPLDEKDVDPRCDVPIHLPVDADPSDYLNTALRGHIENIDTEYEETEYSPENGTFVVGNSLKAALEKYGREDRNGELYYKVLIEFYKDGERIETTKELHGSLEHRYNLASSSEDWGEHYEHYIWAQMTADEIESFEPDEGYGCALHLYDARLGYPFELMSNIINGYYNNGVYIE